MMLWEPARDTGGCGTLGSMRNVTGRGVWVAVCRHMHILLAEFWAV